MQPQRFDIGGDQARPFAGAHNLRQRGIIATGKDIFERESVGNARDAEPAYLSTSTATPRDAQQASDELDKVESRLDKQAASDSTAAYLAVLACDGRIYTEGLAPGIGCAGFAPALAGRPGRLTLASMAVIMSSSGDFAFTYGKAEWDKDGAAKHGSFVRIWQRRGNSEDGGWKLVFDELVAA
jgi:hypothetical protein